MANGEHLPQRLYRRGISNPFAYTLNDEKQKVLVSAEKLATELNGERPPKNTKFFCKSCGGEMYFTLGRALANKPKTLFEDVQRTPARFQHKPGLVIQHLQTETNEIVGDVMDVLYQFGQRQGFEPSLIQDSAKDVWGINFHRVDPLGEPVKITFIIAANPSAITNRYPEAIIITTTTGQAGDRKRLTLRGYDGRVLSSSEVKKYITSARLDSLMVSGHYVRDVTKKVEGQEHYLPKQLKLMDAVNSIVEGSRVFVDGINRVNGYRIETNARFGLFDSDQRDIVQNMVDSAPLKHTRQGIAESIANEFGLSIINDSSTLTTTNRFRFGRASVLFIPDFTQGTNVEGIKKGQRKILINPSPDVLVAKIDPELWRDTMVIYLNDSKRAKALSSKLTLVRAKNPDINIQIRNVSLVNRGIREVGQFLELELKARDEYQELTKRGEVPTRAKPEIETPGLTMAFDHASDWQSAKSTLDFLSNNGL